MGGSDLIKQLAQFGCHPSRQTGSHVRLTRQIGDEQYHLTVPLHKPLRVDTLNAILSQAADQSELLRRLSQ